MSNFDVKFDNKEAYALFMLDNTMGLEGRALSNSPVFGRKSTAEAKRAELADKVNSFLRQHESFIETDVDQERARALTARANVVANPFVHPALVAKGVAAAAVVATVALGADHFFNNAAVRNAVQESIVTAAGTVSNTVKSIPGNVSGFVSNQYNTVASYMPNMPWTTGHCDKMIDVAIEGGASGTKLETSLESLWSCYRAGGNWTRV